MNKLDAIIANRKRVIMKLLDIDWLIEQAKKIKIRPVTSQTVIEEFSKIIDSQDEKGMQKYGESIDSAEGYDWKLMALEETADLQKYLVKEIRRLEGEKTYLERRNDQLIKRVMELKKRQTFFEDVLMENLHLAIDNKALRQQLKARV
ncbi:hypothetical protein [Bacillus sp. B-jedd]|uniref:hypothetical protein n=1 Tax=Bacillus sp. B-jedd TaxID=1476857 RepID=UPI0005155F39|nr:hypothetical protein [Bacillus sp. B-jedd]CEG29591.1 hypothetical protein BN1002_04549 [Bacillus sp. B-jedd]